MAKNNWSTVKSKNRLNRDISRYQPTPFTKVVRGVSADAPQCPLCSAFMIVRFSKRGRFWGCITFPKCKGIKGI